MTEPLGLLLLYLALALPARRAISPVAEARP